MKTLDGGTAAIGQWAEPRSRDLLRSHLQLLMKISVCPQADGRMMETETEMAAARLRPQLTQLRLQTSPQLLGRPQVPVRRRCLNRDRDVQSGGASDTHFPAVPTRQSRSCDLRAEVVTHLDQRLGLMEELRAAGFSSEELLEEVSLLPRLQLQSLKTHTHTHR